MGPRRGSLEWLRRLRPRLRGIFSRLLIVFVLIGLVPFAAMSWWAWTEARERMTQAVIEHWLVRLSREIAVQIDLEVRRMRGLVTGWAEDGTLAALLERRLSARDEAGETLATAGLHDYLRNAMKTRRDVMMILVQDETGNVLADWVQKEGEEGHPGLTGSRLEESLPEEAVGEREWIQAAFLSPETRTLSARDWHLSHLLATARGETLPSWEDRPRRTAAYSVGFAGSILVDGRARGAIAVVFSCSEVQAILDDVITRFEDQKEENGIIGRYSTGYPFLFASDANTVIAHKYQKHLGDRLIEDLGKETFALRMRRSTYGSHRYDYPIENPKIAGFAHCAGARDSGFGWIISVGIDSADIYADVITFRNVLRAGFLVLSAAVFAVALFFSTRLSRPLLRLVEHTRLLARGHLDARIQLKTGDEIETLGGAFNRMAAELEETNRLLIEAEKNAAWKEMARQVAHEIKNPLTPIMLSAQQLQRAHEDEHPAFDEILEDATASIIEQCKALKRIASDFMAYARLGGNQRKLWAINELLEEVERTYRPSAEAKGFSFEVESELPDELRLLLDGDDFRRLLINLVNNGIESLPGPGGRIGIRADLATRDERKHVRVAVSDTGVGIPKEHRAKLFEPSFSDRTGGTGLGLAICKKIVEDLRGRIEVASEPGRGTTMTVWIPLEPD